MKILWLSGILERTALITPFTQHTSAHFPTTDTDISPLHMKKVVQSATCSPMARTNVKNKMPGYSGNAVSWRSQLAWEIKQNKTLMVCSSRTSHSHFTRSWSIRQSPRWKRELEIWTLTWLKFKLNYGIKEEPEFPNHDMKILGVWNFEMDARLKLSINETHSIVMFYLKCN